MTREEALRTVNYWYIGTVREHAHWLLINQIYDDFEQQLADYKKLIEEQEITIAELKEIHSIDSTMFIRLKKRIDELEAPKSCQLCKYWTDSTLQVCTWHDIDTTNIYHYCNGCDEYEPKDN